MDIRQVGVAFASDIPAGGLQYRNKSQQRDDRGDSGDL